MLLLAPSERSFPHRLKALRWHVAFSALFLVLLSRPLISSLELLLPPSLKLSLPALPVLPVLPVMPKSSLGFPDFSSPVPPRLLPLPLPRSLSPQRLFSKPEQLPLLPQKRLLLRLHWLLALWELKQWPSQLPNSPPSHFPLEKRLSLVLEPWSLAPPKMLFSPRPQRADLELEPELELKLELELGLELELDLELELELELEQELEQEQESALEPEQE